MWDQGSLTCAAGWEARPEQAADSDHQLMAVARFCIRVGNQINGEFPLELPHALLQPCSML